MNIKKILSENMFTAFFALCMVIISESAVLRLSDNRAPFAVGITALISVVVTVVFYLNRKNVVAYIGVAAIIFLTLWLFHIAKVPAAAFSINTAKHIVIGRTLKTSEIVFVTSVISLLFSAVMFPLFRIGYARYSAAALTTLLLVHYGICELMPDFPEVFSASGIILSVITEFCLMMNYRKKITGKLNGVLSFLLPLFTLFSIFIGILPSSDKPISWQFFINIASGIADKCEQFVNEIVFVFKPGSSEFNISMQGFSDSGSAFGGGLSENSSSQMRVTFLTTLRSSTYFIGNVSDTYTCDGWTRTGDDTFSENDPYLDYCEAMLAFERASYTKEDLNNFTSTTSVSIVYDEIITKTMFYPLKTFYISGSARYDASMSSIKFKTRAKSGDSYSLSYLNINYHSEEVEKILENPFSYNNEDGMNGHSLDSKIPDEIEDILKRRAGYIKETYTVLPDFITQRTYDLADDITKNCSCDYQKLCAIESYLNRYTYTTTPGDVPDDFDPVDYFLFESGEGYCTYFASAMTVLARCEGIPIRYVQGFMVDKGKMNSLKDHPVSGSSAHAWAEAYIEGMGWIPFEPTASFNSTRYSYQGYQDQNVDQNDWNTQKHTHNDDIPDPQDIIAENKNNGNISLYIIISCTSLSGIILLILLYIAIKIRIFIKRYRTGTDTEKFMICYRMIIYLCEKSRHKLKEGDTIDKFAARLSDMLPDDKISFLQITYIFDRIRYGSDVASDDERRNCEEFVRNMFVEIKENRSKVSAFWIFAVYCLKK